MSPFKMLPPHGQSNRSSSSHGISLGEGFCFRKRKNNARSQLESRSGGQDFHGPGRLLVSRVPPPPVVAPQWRSNLLRTKTLLTFWVFFSFFFIRLVWNSCCCFSFLADSCVFLARDVYLLRGVFFCCCTQFICSV